MSTKVAVVGSGSHRAKPAAEAIPALMQRKAKPELHGIRL
jgi:hypothetical protein